LPKVRVILSSRYAAIDGFTHVSRCVPVLLVNKVRLLTQMITHVYGVPLSRRTTALFDSAPCTPVETEQVSAPTMKGLITHSNALESLPAKLDFVGACDIGILRLSLACILIGQQVHIRVIQ